MRGFARTGAAEATANQPYVVVSTRRFPVTYASFAARPWRRQGVTAAALDQSPEPGFAEKYFSNLPSSPSCSLASAGASFFWVMFGQALAYSALTPSHFSSPGSVSGLIASAGHSGSQTPQSMHSSGWITSMLSPS